MEDEKKVVLDSEAQSLFEQLGGLETWKDTRPVPSGSDRLSEHLLEEQRRHDAVRIQLVQITRLISRYLANEAYADQNTDETQVFAQLSKELVKLAVLPGHLECILIRFRGTPADPDLPEKYDYEVTFGATNLDSQMAARVARRNGSRWAQLSNQLVEAFAAMATYGVNNILIRLPDNLQHQLSGLRLCLKTLSGFRQARQTGTPILIGTGKNQRTIPLVNDENMFPDPNLTLLAGLNGLSDKSMQTLVDKVDVWLRRKGAATDVKKYAGIYNAALELPKIRAQLKKPLVEMNNVKWLIVATEDEEVSQDKVHVANLAMDTAGASPQRVAKIIQSVYGDDFAKINTLRLGERLNMSTDLLNVVDARAQESDLKKEVLGNLQERLDQVKDQVIDDVHVREDTGEERQAGQAASADTVHSQIFRLVSFYKGRSATRKKMVGMVHRAIEFTERDYLVLAKDFRISKTDAQTLVDKLKGCFDQDGRFLKSAFGEATALFRQYEQKIFQFLWHHMKDVILPQDRVSFLNALQMLTTQMNQPRRAFKILIEDICSDPATVHYSDNKAVMLANLILHRDKSLADYEITPEDIVLTRHSIDEEVVQYAGWRIEKDHEQFFAKAQTIHKKLSEALRLGKTTDQQISARGVISLERELFIFLTLVACDTGKSILRSAVYEFGDPAAEIYHYEESGKCMTGLIQNLRVALRGLGSVGTSEDVPLIERLKSHEESFARLKNDPQHRAQARLLGDWVEEAVKIIKFRS